MKSIALNLAILATVVSGCALESQEPPVDGMGGSAPQADEPECVLEGEDPEYEGCLRLLGFDDGIFWDEEFSHECRMLKAEDGATRCLPFNNIIENGFSFFTDPGCSDGYIYQVTEPVDRFVTVEIGQTFVLNAVPFEGQTAYAIIDGQCRTVGIRATPGVYLGELLSTNETVPASEFAEAK